MTVPILIPTAKNVAHYAQTTTLDGRTYRLEFDWIQRWQRWTLSLYTSGGEPLLLGAPLLSGNDLLAPHRWDDRLPPGSLGVFNSQDQGGDPGLTDFGTSGAFTLIYVPAEEEEPDEVQASVAVPFVPGDLIEL